MTEPKTDIPQDNDLSAATGEEARFFGNLPQQTGKWPDGVERVEYRFGEDTDGSPAVWITIIAKNELTPSRKAVDDLTKYSNKLREAVLNSEFGRWPYIQIKAA
jgi:hypothetical protein